MEDKGMVIREMEKKWKKSLRSHENHWKDIANESPRDAKEIQKTKPGSPTSAVLHLECLFHHFLEILWIFIFLVFYFQSFLKVFLPVPALIPKGRKVLR